MKISIKTDGQLGKTQILFVPKSAKKSFPKALEPYKSKIQPLLSEDVFKGEQRSSFFLPSSSKESPHLILIGRGEESSYSYERVRQAGAKAYKELKGHGQAAADILTKSLVAGEVQEGERLCQALAEGLILASYKCDEFKKAGPDKKKEVGEIFLHVSSDKQASAEKGLSAGKILGEAVNFAKRLGNAPGNLMTPAILAEEAKKQMEGSKIALSVWDKKRIARENMGGLLGVSLGSSQEPRFIIMEYKGADSSKKPIAFVGKGLTFDSGGISLKPSLHMEEMKFDMCGAAAVIGAMLAIERLKLKVNVLGLVPSSENMPGQSANKPGDILKARNGKTMEVLNTDAEGRLILADALSYASEQNPQAIFDAATLTGAIIAALGNIFTGVFTKNDRLFDRIKQASEKSGERIWRLPLTKEHARDIKSAIADVANMSSTKGAGSSTAAAFLENFVDKNIPWAHFDIAGTAWNVHNRLEYCSNKLASGVMARTFVELARSYE